MWPSKEAILCVFLIKLQSWLTLMEAIRVSILINNYNYSQYIGQAIDSALKQEYSDVEVIVVDDGSVDNSREVIDNYGEQLISVFKKNGGQASAMNAGYDACSGDVIIFLDSDDVLLPKVSSDVAEVFRLNSLVVKVQFRLRVVNANLEPTGGVLPPSGLKMPNGDITDQIARCRSYTHPPTSGNAFRRSAIDGLMPIPEEIYKKGSASYLVYNAPMYGEITSLDYISGLYRMHDVNISESDVHNDAERLTKHVEEEAFLRRKQVELFREVKGREIPEVGWGDITHIKNRIMLKVMYPDDYPYSDNIMMLCCKGVTSTILYPDLRMRDRPIWAMWFIAMLIAPRSLSVNLINQVKNESKRSALLSLVLGVRN